MGSKNLQTCVSLSRTAQSTLTNIGDTFKIQLLSNCEQLEQHLREVLPPDQFKDSVLLIENLLKSPFRRQIGRINSVKRSLTEINTKLENEGAA